MRIGIVEEFFGEGIDADVHATVQKAIDVYESLGAVIQRVSLPHLKYSIAAYYIIATAEASAKLSAF